MSYLYWLEKEAFEDAKAILNKEGFSLSPTLLTPCQVMRAKGKKVIYAPPSVWSRICIRQGSWYRGSDKKGKTMMMSEIRLPESLDAYLEATHEESDFKPEALPSQEQLQEVVNTEAYQSEKPDGWERIIWWDRFMIKTFFRVFRFWKWGENLKTFWLSHKANHANFVSKKYTTKMDNEDVAYSLTENSGVCSSCVEFFNVVTPESRKLVRSCPGSIVFGGAPRNSYIDVKVEKKSEDLAKTAVKD